MGPIIESKPLTPEQRINRIARFAMLTWVGVWGIVRWWNLPDVPWLEGAVWIAASVEVFTQDKKPRKDDPSVPTPPR